MAESFSLILNGRPIEVSGVAANTTLLEFLRSRGLTGTKQGCAEGDCGACSVALVETDASGARSYRAMNSCIALVPMFAGRELVTVEGVGTRQDPHAVQAALVKHAGSQCGFCTPGFVVSMFEAAHRKDLKEQWQVADQLAGNLCRCTGYRPIRDAAMEVLSQSSCSSTAPCATACARACAPAAVAEAPSSPASYASHGQTFLRPTRLSELLELRSLHPQAHLVAGATEIGVDITKKHRPYPLLISTEAVQELRAIQKFDGAWHIGGAATLTQLEEALAGEYPELDKMFQVFASRQIRNRATLAGNLVTASPIGDMAPVMLALDASMVLASAAGERTVPLSDFFLSYRKTAMQPGEVVRTIVLPRTAPGVRRISDSFKVSKRRELDISIVATGFCVELDAAGVVVTARLGYGGVAATPTRARKTEQALLGRPWTQETLQAVTPILASEFSPIDDVRGSAAYRRGLIVSLFEKFFSGERSLAQDEKPTFAVSTPSVAAEVGKDLRHESALGHVTGTALYVDDLAQKRSMLELWPVCSPHAHARILARDATRARAMPGVVAVLMAEDIPGENDVGAIRKDEILLADTEVSFHGHLVAVVLAETVEQARAAAAAVEVHYEPLPAILTLEEAIREGSYHTQPHTIRRGDCERALTGSAHVLRGRFALGGQEHFYLETHASFAEVTEDGEVTVVSSTQHPSEVQAVVSHVLHIPRSKVVVQAPRMGGGFGGKETQGNTWAALVALGAWKSGRPVRVMLDRDLDMQLTGKRHPFLADFEVACDAEGRLLALKAQLVSNGGWALDLSESILDRALFHIDNGYFIPNVEVVGRVAKTHLVSNTAFRGFGGPQGMLIIEEVLARVAQALGLPPEEVRERNLYRGGAETNTTHYGQQIGDNRLETLWHATKASAQLSERRAAVTHFNATHSRVKRGIAITPMKFGISFTASFLNQAGALVNVYRDGSIQVSHGGTEMGQGLHTKMQGIAMRELGLPASSVRVLQTSTDKVPNTSATAASSGADLNGAAVRNACSTLKERLAPVACGLLKGKLGVEVAPEALRFEQGRVFVESAPDQSLSFSELVEKAYVSQVSLSATGFYRTPGIQYDKASGKGKPFFYFVCGVAVSEVEVDGDTGMKRVLRVDIIEDAGDSLNPAVDRGQIEGGFVQGLGWLTGEELKWDAKGRLLTHSASTYQIPAFSDAPMDFRVELMPRAAQPGVVHGSKAVGEPPFMLAMSAREAIRDAVAAFGAPGGAVELPSPATHESIFLAVRRRLEATCEKDARGTA